MRRLFWVALGVGVGAAVVYQVNRTVRQFGPAGAGAALSRIGADLADFRAAVRVEMAERETELRSALGVEDDPTDN